jgi:NAD(P)-dependent dehydrogenase (short-subunit alcohol dehydrogenase family)
MGRLNGKRALVTGGTRGLGEAISKKFAAEGAAVAVTGRTADSGARVVSEIEAAGGTAVYVRLDLADEASVKAAMAEAVEKLGGLDIVVNNAAPTEFITGSADGDLSMKTDGDVVDMTTEDWHKITIPSIDGLFWSLKYSLPHLKGHGSIINISSTAGIMGAGGLDAYATSKGALQSLTRSVAVNHRGSVRCNCLVAGPFETPGLAPVLAIPAIKQAFDETVLTGSVGKPEDMAAVAAFIASDEACYVNGQLIPVDGGFSMIMPTPRIEAAMAGADR